MYMLYLPEYETTLRIRCPPSYSSVFRNIHIEVTFDFVCDYIVNFPAFRMMVI